MGNYRLDNKTVFLMDGASDIGEELLEYLISLGAEVLFLKNSDHASEKYHMYSKTTDSQSVIGELQLSQLIDEKVMNDRLTQLIREKASTVDILVNNLENKTNKDILEVSIEEWNQDLWVNLDLPFLILKAIVPIMQENQFGSIIHLSSISAINGGNGEATYASMKSALESMNKTLSRELNGDNIRVNAIGFRDDHIRNNIEPKFLNRTVSIQDIGNMVYFLSTPLSSYINGQVLLVDGGGTYL